MMTSSKKTITPAEVFESIDNTNRKSQEDRNRDRYSDIGSIEQISGKKRPQKNIEYTTKGGKIVNATKVIKIISNNQLGKFSLIATQCPMANTLDSFCDMLYQSNSLNAVIVLGKTESGKLENYWSSTKATLKTNTETNEYSINYDKQGSDDGTKPYVLKIINNKSNQPKKISLYHYARWEDHNAPSDGEEFEKFIKQFKNARKLIAHCSAGVGRTGTFAACLYAFKTKEKNPKKIVEDLRKHRTLMVTTAAQFDYICKFIARNCLGKEIKYTDNIKDYDALLNE